MVNTCTPLAEAYCKTVSVCLLTETRFALHEICFALHAQLLRFTCNVHILTGSYFMTYFTFRRRAMGITMHGHDRK